jgi:uncharacterized protein YidB (DUF937 family)
MGLLDVLTGMQNGPRGQRAPGQSGGMSPLTMAALGLLAYKAFQHLSDQRDPAASGTARGTQPVSPPGGTINAGLPGGLGGLLSGGLGGLLSSGAAGGILSSGLNELIKQFQQSGQADVANSWVGTGPNKSISPNDLAKALGADQIGTLAAQTGMSRDELITGLSQVLPEVVDKLTPQGHIPTEQELSRSL